MADVRSQMNEWDYDEEYYERSGLSGWHQCSFPAIAMAIDRLAQKLPEDGAVLDFGCGDGFYGRALSRKGNVLDGVDFSPFLRDHPNRQYYANFAQGDLGAPWASVAKYDLLFSSEVIEHVQDYRQFLANAFAALKPGGRMLLTTTTFFWSLFVLLIVHRRQTSVRSISDFVRGCGGDERARTRFVLRFWDYFGGHYHGFTKRQLRNALDDVGFITERIDYLHVQDTFPVRYLDQPYEKRFPLLVKTAVPLIRATGQAINWACRRFDLNAPNVLVVAIKPESHT
jgi:SAM-dependent methyltransferase